ncbi:protein FAR1-RELATED SEQUENCE 5-like [Papaver somniferum]|uniref:protein FAR1-RELATED SEQUENCE 5-like n=1 Tax=Papaver somniferum TaxID=3469 RepID=UPI000E702594|nr:protein FAR1-RELATED SEQUENCE 5-like [Papaver somniferum]
METTIGNNETGCNDMSSKDLKPAVGLEFSSIEIADLFYKEYGRSKGFSTRKTSSYASANRGGISKVIFVCGCEGVYGKDPNYDDSNSFDDDEVEQEVVKRKKNTSTMRTNCKAMMRIALDVKCKIWYTNAFVDEHNHVMVSPKKRVLMRSNKYMLSEANSLAGAFNKNRLPVGKIASLFGHSENNTFTPREVYNHLRMVRKSLLDVGDAEALLDYFRKRTIENPSFYYAIQVDEVGRAENLFWVDARSRMAYSRFADAVTFDTTYRTNKYNMPFAPFIGTNLDLHYSEIRQKRLLHGCLRRGLKKWEVPPPFNIIHISNFIDLNQTSLRQLVESCDQALERMYVREREEDYKSIHMKRIFASQDLLVRHASKVFTRVIFNKVHDEFNASLKYQSKIIEVNGDEHSYKVFWKVDEDIVEEFPLKINALTKSGTCGCQNFEFKGISCRHLHHILVSRLYETEIPPHFIMERWTINANKCAVLGSDRLEINDDKVGIEAMRISHCCRRSSKLAYMFLGKSEKAYEMAMDFLNQAFEKAREIDNVELEKEHGEDITIDQACTNAVEVPDDVSNATTAAKMILGDPRISQTKEWYRTVPDKKKPRTYKYFKYEGHDPRTCKQKKADQLAAASANSGSGTA